MRQNAKSPPILECSVILLHTTTSRHSLSLWIPVADLSSAETLAGHKAENFRFFEAAVGRRDLIGGLTMISKILLAGTTTLLVVGVANAGETINEAGALAQVVDKGNVSEPDKGHKLVEYAGRGVG